ncbi:hypothetical protein ADUPG1_013023 [Aduncisulcus paluster]|uniref:Uncharacterized protein n=1 Tax=Aduncisulcus paluster TaxID=2918883 RepID=A0ABQ5K1H7_9EUKA|nr:hypothetical protein ADUPG1_013023 [Aduncisulcus paluster]
MELKEFTVHNCLKKLTSCTTEEISTESLKLIDIRHAQLKSDKEVMVGDDEVFLFSSEAIDLLISIFERGDIDESNATELFRCLYHLLSTISFKMASKNKEIEEIESKIEEIEAQMCECECDDDHCHCEDEGCGCESEEGKESCDSKHCHGHDDDEKKQKLRSEMDSLTQLLVTKSHPISRNKRRLIDLLIPFLHYPDTTPVPTLSAALVLALVDPDFVTDAGSCLTIAKDILGSKSEGEKVKFEDNSIACNVVACILVLGSPADDALDSLPSFVQCEDVESHIQHCVSSLVDRICMLGENEDKNRDGGEKHGEREEIECLSSLFVDLVEDFVNICCKTCDDCKEMVEAELAENEEEEEEEEEEKKEGEEKPQQFSELEKRNGIASKILAFHMLQMPCLPLSLSVAASILKIGSEKLQKFIQYCVRVTPCDLDWNGVSKCLGNCMFLPVTDINAFCAFMRSSSGTHHTDIGDIIDLCAAFTCGADCLIGATNEDEEEDEGEGEEEEEEEGEEGKKEKEEEEEEFESFSDVYNASALFPFIVLYNTGIIDVCLNGLVKALESGLKPETGEQKEDLLTSLTESLEMLEKGMFKNPAFSKMNENTIEMMNGRKKMLVKCISLVGK